MYNSLLRDLFSRPGIHTIWIFLVFTPLMSQEYFQQKVNYNLNVELDTIGKELKVDGQIDYQNNSELSLEEIYFHIWWNAYSNKTTAFADQNLTFRNFDFHFADKDDLGGYTSLSFSHEGKNLPFQNWEDENKTHVDVIKLKLNQPLEPGEQITLDVKYILDIPKAFSRGGYLNGLYQMSQWYPKPAVLDPSGWHPMPYLSLGEFYSEFGDYRIALTMPIDFSVVSTGKRLENQSQLMLQDRKRKVVFKAKNVHDFAWFASDKFIPYSESVDIGEERKQVNVFVQEDNESWEKVMNYAKDALQFYSEEIGDYPYPQVTVVQGTCGKGDAMEYPMITLVDFCTEDQQFDHLVSHEIAHNWFYGILGFNERLYSWMDEGLTSFFDHKHNNLKYKNPTYSIKAFNSAMDSDASLLENGILAIGRTGRSQKIDQRAENFDFISYVAMNYEKTAMAFSFLESYVTPKVFKKAIRRFYNKWKFKHPQPNDLQLVFEDVSGKNLDWFFKDYLGSKGSLDYSLSWISKNGSTSSLKVKKEGLYSLPFKISALDKSNQVINEYWVESNSEKVQNFNLPSVGVHSFALNYKSASLDNYRDNDKVKNRKRLNKLKPVKINFAGLNGDSYSKTFNLFPSVLYNSVNKAMVGLHLYNDLFPTENFRYWLSPHISLSDGSVNGVFALEKDWLINKGKKRKLMAGFRGQRFGLGDIDLFENNLNYYKLEPSIGIYFSKNNFSNSFLEYRLHHLNLEKADFMDAVLEIKSDNFNVHQLNWVYNNFRRLSRNTFKIRLEYEKYNQPFEQKGEYLKATFELDKDVYYNPKSKFFLRFFAGYFLKNSERNSSSFASIFTRGSFGLSGQGFNDHTFENYFFDRDGLNDGGLSQINITDGGFKNTFNQARTLGMSNDFMFAVNSKIDIPVDFIIKLRPYVDLAYVSTKEVNNDPLKGKLFFSGGIAFEISEYFGLYFPLVNSNNIDQNYLGQSFLSKATFSLNLRLINLWKFNDQPSLLIP